LAINFAVRLGINSLADYIIIAHYDDTPFWISAGTNKNDLEWPWMPDST